MTHYTYISESHCAAIGILFCRHCLYYHSSSSRRPRLPSLCRGRRTVNTLESSDPAANGRRLDRMRRRRMTGDGKSIQQTVLTVAGRMSAGAQVEKGQRRGRGERNGANRAKWSRKKGGAERSKRNVQKEQTGNQFAQWSERYAQKTRNGGRKALSFREHPLFSPARSCFLLLSPLPSLLLFMLN